MGLDDNGKQSTAYEGDSFDPWEQNGVDYYDDLVPTTTSQQAGHRSQSGSSDTRRSSAGDDLAYVYRAPTSFEEQPELYYNQMLFENFFQDRSNSNLPDLIVDENDFPTSRSRVEDYQRSLSQPKDWCDALPRWEQDVYDNLAKNPTSLPSYSSNNQNTSITRSPENLRTPASIYQLPAFRNTRSRDDTVKTYNKNHASPSYDIREAYARGKVAGLTGNVPEYVKNWPDDMQGNFYLGMGEGQGTKNAAYLLTYLLPTGGVKALKYLKPIQKFFSQAHDSNNHIIWGTYKPSRILPRTKAGVNLPDTNIPHTQIGQAYSSKGYIYTQAREWGFNSKGELVPLRDIDFTDHGRPELHPNPHQHRHIPNPTGGTPKRSKVAEPLSILEELDFDSIDSMKLQ